MFFENLKPWELGLLIFSLELGGVRFAHKIGHAKAFGFGSVRIEVEGITTRKDAGQFEQKDEKFKKDQVKKGFSELRGRFPKHWKGHFNNLLQMLWWSGDRSPMVRYPALRKEDDSEGLPGYEELKEHIKFKDAKRNNAFTFPWVKWHEISRKSQAG